MRWTITSRTIAGFLLMAGLLATVNFAMVLYINRVQAITEKIFDTHVSSLLSAMRMEGAIQAQRRRLSNFLLSGDNEWVTLLLQDRRNFTSIRRRIQGTARTPEERVLLSRIDALYEGFLKAQEEAIVWHRQGETAMARDALVGASREQTEALLNACEEFSWLNEHAIEAARSQVLQDNANARRTIYGIAVVGVLIGGLMGVIIARGVVRPISELVLKVRSADGEVVERVELSEGKALESLGQGVESLMQKIRSVSADLTRSERMLIQAEKLAVAGQLSAGIAHEIRNPLTAIKTMAFVLREDLPPGDSRRIDFDIMGGEFDQMERSIQRLLDFARPPDPEFAPVRLEKPLANAVALLAFKTLSQGVQTEVNPDPGIVIQADQRQIEQVFVNLILNALQSMPEGGKITITTKRGDAETRGWRHPFSASGRGEEEGVSPSGERGWVEVEVADTGRGIPEALMGRIFEPFVTGREGGTGLGLVVVRKIVEQHGGRITARNRPEGGAIFTVVFPLKEEHET